MMYMYNTMDSYYSIGEIVQGYMIKDILGEGRYGIAYLAVNYNNEKVVIKQLKNEMLIRTREKSLYEQLILGSLNHPRFPRFLGRFNDNYKECYILEYIEGKTLREVVKKYKYKFDRDEIYEIADKLIELMEILHNNNIVHRDIRLPNVIIKKNMDIALIDFGLARFTDINRYEEKKDYWYLGNLLMQLYYTNYKKDIYKNKKVPWHEKLDLNIDEKNFLKKLVGINSYFNNDQEVEWALRNLKF